MGWPGCCSRAGAEGPVEADAGTDGEDQEAERRGQAAVAAESGVSTFAVRAALGRVPARAAAPADGGMGREPSAGAESAWAQDTLPVLPDVMPRDRERALARFGLLGEGAAPVFVPGARYPLAGLLLALPALAQTGLAEASRGVYGRLKDGFYGLEMMLVTLVFLALLREPPAEGARARIPPAALSLDRAPEVKTIRRKLGELAAAGKAAQLQLATARRHAAMRPDDLGFLYIDGHARAYFGTRDVQKMHLARMKHPGLGTEETWVTGQSGDPMLVVMAEPSAQVKDLLPDPRRICGGQARPVLCFDRGGWSPDLFAEIIAAGFGLLTYRKNEAGKDIPPAGDEQFAVMTWAGDDGRGREYDLADGTTELPVTSGDHKGQVLRLRQVTRRDKGRQVHILTTSSQDELPAPGVIYRMTGRWREENWFRYGRAHFALDALDSCAVAPDDPQRLIPNPGKKKAAAAVKTARSTLADAEAARQRKLDQLRSPPPAARSSSPTRRSPGWAPPSPRPSAPCRPPRPRQGKSRRRSRSASTTRTWCGSTPRPSSSPTRSRWPRSTPRPPWPAP